MGNAARKLEETVNETTGEVIETLKKERTPQETENLKRAFQLGFNSYTVGSIKDIDFDKLHNHVFQGDGDYVVVNNRIGNFFSRMREIDRPGLPIELGKNLVKLKVPKLPSHIYHQIVAFFRDIADEMGDAEAFVQVYYDLQDKKYVCHVPEQEVSKTSVRYDATKNLNEINRKRYTFVFEIHSHNTMGAFFSGTDNADEKDTRFYGVMGKIKDKVIEEKYRYLVMGKEFTLGRDDIFDLAEDETVPKNLLTSFLQNKGNLISKTDVYKLLSGNTVQYPKKWRKKVKKYTYTSSYVGGSQNGHTYGSHTPKTHGIGDYPGYDDEGGDAWYGEGKPGTKDGNRMTSYNEDEPMGFYEEMVDIDDTFNIDNYEEEIQGICIESFVASLGVKHIALLMESLVDHGHDGLIQDYLRR